MIITNEKMNTLKDDFELINESIMAIAPILPLTRVIADNGEFDQEKVKSLLLDALNVYTLANSAILHISEVERNERD